LIKWEYKNVRKLYRSRLFFISEEEYLKGELTSEIKHEYIDGSVYATHPWPDFSLSFEHGPDIHRASISSPNTGMMACGSRTVSIVANGWP
jgi:hypothetical protein